MDNQSPPMLPTPAPSPRRIWPALLIAILLTAIVTGSAVYTWQRITQNLVTDLSVGSPATTLLVTPPVSSTSPSYKTVRKSIGNLNYSFDVPVSWSVAKLPEAVGENALADLPSLSVGQEDVEYGDTNWSQVDVYLVRNDIVDSLIAKEKAFDPDITSTIETIGGFQATVFTSPLDNGEVTKGGTGGKRYYIRLPEIKNGLRTLYIQKQAQGDADFEAGFEHLIQTLTLKTLSN
ncbi:hypothetical protein HYT95_00655 [Candidatus Peregrinibacteria bacterium]|nr:hypothetical protein [Candidatus Peregrinibacteria bacterium]